MEILIPAAGLSTRFPGTKPKYMWTAPNGTSMLYNAICQYVGKYSITIGVLEDHKLFNVEKFISTQFGDKVKIVVLPKVTSGPADTIYQMINQINLPLTTSVFIKDTDSFFTHIDVGGNYICVSETDTPTDNKSFVKVENDVITDIAEKKIISNIFCVGGYKFNTVLDYINGFHISRDTTNTKEFFVSNVIKVLIDCGKEFQKISVSNYSDVGTFADWARHNDLGEQDAYQFYKEHNS